MKKGFLILGIVLLSLFSFLPVHSLNSVLAAYPNKASFNSMSGGPYGPPASHCPTAIYCAVGTSFVVTGQGTFQIIRSITLNFQKNNCACSGTVQAAIFNANSQNLATAIPASTTPIFLSDPVQFSAITVSFQDFTLSFPNTPKILGGQVYVMGLLVQNTTNYGGISVSGDTVAYGGTGSRYDTNNGWATTVITTFFILTGESVTSDLTGGILVFSTYASLLYLGLGASFVLSGFSFVRVVLAEKRGDLSKGAFTTLIISLMGTIGFFLVLVFSAGLVRIF